MMWVDTTLAGVMSGVQAAENGLDTIDKFSAHTDDIQLALLDVIMSIKNSNEVYDRVRAIRSDIKVLFMSGHPADVILQRGILENEFACDNHIDQRKKVHHG